MISIDDRAGSSDLTPILRRRGLPVESVRMHYGDVSFMGNGPISTPISIGIEVKTLNDLLSCVQDGRFAGHQLPGLVSSYDHVWLLGIGVWRPRSSDGVLETKKSKRDAFGRPIKTYWTEAGGGHRRFMYRDLCAYLFTLEHKAGLRFAQVRDYDEAAVWISSLYSWWTAKDWEEHRSHLAMHDGMRDQLFDHALLVRPTLARCMAAQLPKIGQLKSAAVAKRFPTVAAMVAATEKQWREIDGIGKEVAGQIYRALRGQRETRNGTRKSRA